ncbi:protein of unknown function [Hymenobacter daecheongensis DSM 21074]|uniref:DUF4783 domain-containing protein n=1 Tax=Hymenobacter daecheongensis DSM 21074 TaxID=1121955 RepID=A0A1M6AVH2_9BACT|nr:DUF4783 domain-containing protein [Hymenobacter daecheongensis]SHI40452.1 protein of unknown function [Hymenobacter daecheongensis DSM 21074]
MKRTLLQAVAIVWLMLLSVTVQAQGEAFAPVRNAIRSGSSKELAQRFGSTVELSFDGDKQSYSATQAEFVMKDFFGKNAPASFDFVHYGGSNEGTPYAVGKYVSKGGAYRMFVKMKSAQGNLVIDIIEFTKE